MRTEFVTTLKRKATEILAELEQDHEPVLITQHGRPAAYLIDVETYSALDQRLRMLEGIARGERAIEEGRVVSRTEAKKRMARCFPDACRKSSELSYCHFPLVVLWRLTLKLARPWNAARFPSAKGGH